MGKGSSIWKGQDVLGLTGNDILLRPEQVADGLLLDVGVVLLEVVRQAECHDWQSSVVVRTRLAFLGQSCFRHTFEGVLALLAVDVAHTNVPASSLESFTEQAGVGQGVFHDLAVPAEAEMNQIVVLGDDLCSWTGEVQCVGLFSAAKVVQLEDEVLGQVGFVTPDDPANTSVDETELVAGDVDRLHTGKLEIPVTRLGHASLVNVAVTYHFGPPTPALVKGAMKAPEAPSTWMGMSWPVFFSKSSRILEISSTGS